MNKNKRFFKQAEDLAAKNGPTQNTPHTAHRVHDSTVGHGVVPEHTLQQKFNSNTVTGPLWYFSSTKSH